MKKIIVSTISVVLLLISNHVCAQITFGPKVGLNISNRYDDLIDYKTTTGAHIGGMVNFQTSDYFSIRPELVFSNVGAKGNSPTYYMSINGDGTTTLWPDEFDIGTISFHEKYNVNYLSLPVNFVGQIPINKNFKLQAFAGPYAAIALNATLTREITHSLYHNDQKYTEYEQYHVKMGQTKNYDYHRQDYYMNGFDMGINFGIGCQYNSFVFSTSYLFYGGIKSKN